jgi:hypothetical protein
MISATRQWPVLRQLLPLASGVQALRDGSAVIAALGVAPLSTSAPAASAVQAGSKDGQPPTSTSATSTKPVPMANDDDDTWTEVVHSSGQIYFWNQKTGERRGVFLASRLAQQRARFGSAALCMHERLHASRSPIGQPAATTANTVAERCAGACAERSNATSLRT